MKDKLSVVLEIILSVLSKIWIWVLIAIIVWIMAFNGDDVPIAISDKGDAGTETVEYEEQDTIYLTLNAPDSLNPFVSKSEDVYHLNKLVYESLFDYDSNLGLTKKLASSYKVDTEKASVEITLKRGVYFHNGKKLTSSDVAFSVNCLMQSKKGSAYYDIGQKIVSCYTTGTYSVKIHFKNNYNSSLSDLVFPIVPSNQYNSVSDFMSSSSFKPVGTGRYKVKKYDSLKYLRLEPYAKYYDEKAVKKIEFSVVPDDDEIDSNLMEIGEITCYSDSSKNRKTTASDNNFVVYDYPLNQVDFLVLNTKNKALAVKTVRQAVLNAIDREDILTNCYMGDGILTDTVFYPNYMGVEEKLTYYNDQSKAKELLLNAGYEDTNGDGYIEQNNGRIKKNINLRILVNSNNAMRTAAAKAIKNDLEQVGINATVISVSSKEYKSRINDQNFDILVTGYTINQNYDLRFLYNKKSDWKYVNYAIMDKINEMFRLHTIEEYHDMYAELKDLMIDEAVYYPLVYKKSSLIGVSTFEAGELPVFNNRYYGIESWNWKKILKLN